MMRTTRTVMMVALAMTLSLPALANNAGGNGNGGGNGGGNAGGNGAGASANAGGNGGGHGVGNGGGVAAAGGGQLASAAGALNAAHASSTALSHAAPGSMVGHVAAYDRAMISALALPADTPAQVAARNAAIAAARLQLAGSTNKALTSAVVVSLDRRLGLPDSDPTLGVR